MKLVERATVLHYHRHRIAAHGADAPQALGWRDAASQLSRFEVIAGAADFDGASVLDLGCGTGDLRAFLGQRFRDLRYLGIDQMPEFIDTARQRHGSLPDTEFALGHFDTLALPRADIVVASGALGYRCEDPHWVFNVIARMYAAAERVLVFNVLDQRHFPIHALLVGRDVDEIAAFCRKLAPRVEVVQGYAPDDATLVLRRRSD